MIVDLEKRETENGWFDLEGGGKVHVRLLSREDITEMRKLCMKTVAEYPLLDIDPADPAKGKAHRRFEALKFDEDLWEAELADRSILGWEGIADRTEKPVPVTRENKILLLTVPKFAAVIAEARKVLQERDAEKAKALEKNLPSGPSGA